MHSRPRRPSRFALGAALLLTFATIAPAGAAQPPTDLKATGISPAGRVEGFKSVSGKLAQSDPALVARKDAALVNVMIKLDYDAVAAYSGGIEGFAATSPQVTGKAIDRRAAAVMKYSGYVASQESAFVKALKSKVPKAVVGQSYRDGLWRHLRQDPGQRRQGHPCHRRRRCGSGRPAAAARHRLEPGLPRRQSRLHASLAASRRPARA